MATKEEIKRPEDYVKLVNLTEQPLEFCYDGSVYKVEKDLVVVRKVAEHGLLKTHVMGTMAEPGGYRLKIEEVPLKQRSPGTSFEQVKELESLKEENASLEEQVKFLSSENKDLKKDVKKLETKIENLESDLKEAKKKDK